MKLNWGKTVLIGMGFFGISIVWLVYNTLAPLYLQVGNPEFDAQSQRQLSQMLRENTLRGVILNAENSAALFRLNSEVLGIKGFGLNAGLTGLIMTADNVASLFILPLVGVWSDRVRTPVGRRYPFILIGAPIAALAFIGIPLTADLIDPATSGSVRDNIVPFVAFLAVTGVMLTAMAFLRTPVMALMPDLTPSPLRSKASGVINLMGGVGNVIAALVIVQLFDIEPHLPFIVTGVVLVGVVVLMFFTVKEPDVRDLPPPDSADSDEEESVGAMVEAVRSITRIPVAYRRAVLFLMAAIFGWFIGFNAIETFFSSFAVTELGLTVGQSGQLFAVSLIGFILFALPAGFVGTRFGRKKSIIVGLAIFAVMLLFVYTTRNVTIVAICMFIGGSGFSLVNINALPMMVDINEDESLIGTYTGFYFLASQSASILGPVVVGGIIDASGQQYDTIFIFIPITLVFAIVMMLFVNRGEARDVEPMAVDEMLLAIQE